ncbi:uncharacterized protein LOC134662132 [Cydia amplana]|uniref:uncharacterized protein LOC134662132 n=1 Tax=Cydia amplana TaxID=1869771 RepID=UPI002FE633A4
MIALVLVDLLLVNSILASNDAYFAKGWIPLTRFFVFNQMSNSYAGTRDWKPLQGIDDSNIDYVKEDAIQIITPDQIQTIPNEKSINAWLPSAVADAIPTASDNSSQKAITELNKNQDPLLLKSKPSDVLNKRTVKSNINRRASKLIWDVSSTKDLIMNALTTPEPSIKTQETEKSIKNINVTNNNYEVTEPSNVQELGLEANDLRNEYTNKFDHLLSKYNIKNDDRLNNYARSMLRHKKMLYPSNESLYPSNAFPVSLIPVRYNSLNHLPVDPLLAVLLSNYGFYLHGFYGLQNNYKNLYGYSASNNIHNNKPFGSYKIYSDTDSSN